MRLIEGITRAAPAQGREAWPENKKIPVAQQKAMMHSSARENVALARENITGLLVTHHEQNFSKNPNQIEEVCWFCGKEEYVSSRDVDII